MALEQWGELYRRALFEEDRNKLPAVTGKGTPGRPAESPRVVVFAHRWPERHRQGAPRT